MNNKKKGKENEREVNKVENDIIDSIYIILIEMEMKIG
jgi:hypothetical protein